MKTVAVIQARIGSTRLPGKVMYPLNSVPVLRHVVDRVPKANTISRTVIATSTEPQDDIIDRYLSASGMHPYRGSESDVLGRVFHAAEKHNPDIIVRITGDCPLLDPAVIDTAVERLSETNADYVSTAQNRTFPRGLDVEAFTQESFKRVHDEATESHHREHVTSYYREQPEMFDLGTVTSEMVYDDPQFQHRTELRFALEDATDYEFLHQIYKEMPYHDILRTEMVIRYIDKYGLKHKNANVEQKNVDNASSDSS